MRAIYQIDYAYRTKKYLTPIFTDRQNVFVEDGRLETAMAEFNKARNSTEYCYEIKGVTLLAEAP